MVDMDKNPKMNSDSGRRVGGVNFTWVVKGDGGRDLLRSMMKGIREDPERTFIILPTERMVSEARRYVVEELGGGFTSGIMTPRKLAQTLYGKLGGCSPLGDRDLREMAVRRIMIEKRIPYLKSHGTPLGGMSGRVSRVIGELLLNGVNPGQLKSAAREGRSKDLHEVFSAYISLLRERRIVDKDLLPSEVVKLLGAGSGSLNELTMGIYLPGRMDRSYDDLFRSLADHCLRMDVHEHISRDPPGFLDEVMERPTGNDITIPDRDSNARQMIYSDNVFRALEAQDRLHEVREICRYIKGACSARDLDPGDITVVFPRRETYDKMVSWVFDDHGIPYSTRRDLRIGEVPAVSCVIDLLRSSLQGFPRSGIVRSLSTPYLKLTTGRTEFSGVDVEWITRKGGIYGGGRDHDRSWIEPLRSLMDSSELDDDELGKVSDLIEPLDMLMGALSDLVKGKRSALMHISHLIEILDSLSYIENVKTVLGQDDDGIIIGAAEKFMDLLSDLMKRDRMLGTDEMDFAEFLNHLESAMRDATISSGRGTGVRIMGLREFTGMSSDNVIFGGLTEDNLPFAPYQFRILTDGERSDLSLSALDDRRSSLEDLCISLTSVSDPVLTYYSTARESSVSISPLIEELKMEALETGSDPRSSTDASAYIGEVFSTDSAVRSVSAESVLYDRDALESHLFSGDLIQGCMRGSARRSSGEMGSFNGYMTEPAIQEDLRSRYGEDHIWSASRLEGYRECPYRYFVEHVLYLRPLEDMEPEVPAEKKGIILHAILENFYNSWKGGGNGRIEECNSDRAFQMIRDAALQEMGRYQYHGPYWDALRDHFLGYDLNGGVLRDFIDFESNYSGPFRIRSTEFRFGGEGDLRIGGIEPGSGFRIHGFIDRIDSYESEDGEVLYIWDYKTGKVRNVRDSLQVPLYLAALRKALKGSIPGGGGYYRIPNKGGLQRISVQGVDVWNGGSGVDSSSSEMTKIERDIQRKIEASLKIIDGIRSGAYPRKEKCTNGYCQLSGICRKGEW